MNPIIQVMIAYAVLVKLIPRILTKPTKIDIVDNTVIYLEMTQSYILNASLFVGLVVWLVSKYGQEQQIPVFE
jgi:hypothetical protein